MNAAIPQDDFKGDDAQLVRSISALLTIDAAGSLAPHGIGGHARALLAAAASRLAAATAAQPAQYWLLDVGRTIRAGDEVLGDDYVTWEPVGGVFIGMAQSGTFKPTRRRVAAATAAQPPVARGLPTFAQLDAAKRQARESWEAFMRGSFNETHGKPQAEIEWHESQALARLLGATAAQPPQQSVLTEADRAEAERLARTFDARTELAHDIIDAATLLGRLATGGAHG